MKKLSLIISLAVFALSFAFGQAPAKKKVYDETANAKEQLATAVSKASASKKHILVQVGGNWCAWCMLFDKLVTTDQPIKDYLAKNYEVVHLNYSKENRNEETLAKLNHPERFGFPVFVILNDKGELIHTQNSAYLESDEIHGHDPKIVLEFLQGWSYTALDSTTYIKK